MSQKDPYNPYDPYSPPQSGQYIPPPPPTYQGADVPPESPYHYTAATQQRSRGLVGWLGSAALAAWAVFKYGLVLLFKIPAAGTLLTALLSFGVYAWAWGLSTAAGLVVMLFVHEMGHVVEIRRQGMKATAPIFIPFMGAAIFQRSHPTDALKQAQIGIAGPIAGTIGATAAFVLYGSTHDPIFLITALIGFFINLINLLPVWMLDGAWILAPVSPWFQVLGLVAIAVGVIVFHYVSFLLILVAVMAIPRMMAAFRDAKNPYYTSVSGSARLALGAAWLALVLYLGVMTLQAETLITSLAR